MLQIRNISKKYRTGDLIQTALDNVSLNLRDSEFVAILGPSGSGKTTLLNVIGGLDRYDSGDLIIGGISTKMYKDRDWDSYRNHTIGFVFQSYNLIPHQSILANVELALTISGISRSERRSRAKKALESVGLGNQLHKKPNQMSGGQMQRVAIARALVNDPDILLADEPTGALDSETSIQVMELLKKVAKDRLVVMVTHNPDLAAQYATRIVKLRDGKVTDDSDPCLIGKSELTPPEHKSMGKSSMSFLTSLTLSFNNLRTKKGRTILTSFAGSIGIIGISLILALSTGVNTYISDIQKDTMISYPIVISAESNDLTNMLSLTGGHDVSTGNGENLDAIYPDSAKFEKGSSSNLIKNDLVSFKKYLDNPDSEIHQYVGENGIIYTYDINFDAYTEDSEGNVHNTGITTNADGESEHGMETKMSMVMSSGASNVAENFCEIDHDNETLISPIISNNYEVVYGAWPTNYDEVVLFLDDQNSVPIESLYQLGFITRAEFDEIKDAVGKDKDAVLPNYSYEDFCKHTFNIVPACDYYIENADGTFTSVEGNKNYEKQILDNSIPIKIVGVVRPIKDSTIAFTSPIGYTGLLSDRIIDYSNESAVVKAQVATPEINVLNGLAFEALDDAAKAEQAKTYMLTLNISEKAELANLIGLYTGNMEMATLTDELAKANAVDEWANGSPDSKLLIEYYDMSVAGGTYEANIKAFGKVSHDAPCAISIYADSFESKDAISQCITDYNETVAEESKINYTDYVELLTSSLTSMVDIISYVLIAFVSVSLIVSCIMIGIITHISVMERTKEIGILRAIGASKRNISQVFNAETFIIGICSGALGVGISMLLTIPINAVIGSLLGTSLVQAQLPVLYALALVGVSVVITVIGGLLPARKAAKKDPVIALRSE